VNFCIPNQIKKATRDHRKNAGTLGAQWTRLFIEAFNELKHRVLEYRHGRHEVAGVVQTVRTRSWPTGAPLVSRRREESPIDERLEGAAERVSSVDRSIEAGLAKLDGA
jgi:hypothetical protein